MPGFIRFALVEDQHIVRDGLVSIIGNIPNVEFVFSAENGLVFLDELPKHKIDIVFLDLEMPVLDGIKTFRKLKLYNPDIHVIMLTTHSDPDIAMELIKEGVSAYLLKTSKIQEITLAINQVMEKGRYVSEFAEKIIFEEMKEPNKTNPHQFTERDVQIIRFICDGLTSKEIGVRLCLARKTIENDRLRILRAYDIKSSNELIRLSILDGLYKPRTNQEILNELQQKKEASQLRRFSRYK
ncbi:MAG: DNA-binding response regulator [Flavobacteriia bacterium]|nr:DNA-binding response regulator [Flavobacteriia bacterium]